ncbi:MFS transporter [Paenibacillus yanchengensis]|uniref:MFS transporter n=1 Tax=Paenibacillus yanchengensis TaxID=2035833 RepID=A0ABW4YGN0_9BACL
MLRHPIGLLRATGLLDGISLLVLLLIAMPLKYWAGIDMAVRVVGSLHGIIFVCYAVAIMYAAIRIQWNILWSVVAFVAAFIPFGNFILDRRLKKEQPNYEVKPFNTTYLIYCVVFFSFFDLFSQLPVMSTFAESVGASSFVAGLAVGMYSFSNTFGNILSGVLSDKRNPFSILLSGLILTSGALALYGLIDNTTILLIVRFIHGFVGGLIVPAAFTFLANNSDGQKRGKKGAISGAFVGIAAIIGPAFSGIMASRTSVPSVFGVVAIVGILITVLVYFALKSKATASATPKEKAGYVPLATFFKNKGIVTAYSGAFFLMFSQGCLAYLLPLHVQSLGFDSRLSGYLMSTFGVVAVLVFLLPTNRIFDRVQPLYTLSLGIFLMGFGQLFVSQGNSTSVLYAALACYGIGFALLFPSLNSVLIDATNEKIRGKAYGYFYAFFSLGVVAGSSLISALPTGVIGGFIVTGIILISYSIFALIFTRSQQVQAKQSQF